jgi:hypothetical protein
MWKKQRPQLVNFSSEVGYTLDKLKYKKQVCDRFNEQRN